MEFPITKIENEKVFQDERHSYFYRLNGLDLEHLSSDGADALFDGIKNSLNNLKNNDDGLSKLTLTKESNYFYKIFSLNGKTYLSTDDASFELHGFKNEVVADPVSSVFSENDFWGAIEFEKDHFLLNGTFWRFVNLYEVPSKLSFQQLAAIGDYFIFFRKYPVEDAKKLSGRVRNINQITSDQSYIRNISSETAFKESEQVLEDLIHGEENLFDFCLWYIVREDSKEGLDRETRRIASSLSRMDAKGLVETVGLSTILESYVPGSIPDFKRSHYATSSYLSCLIPFNGNEVHRSGIEFNALDGSEVYINIFNPYAALNFNGLITGKSGSGKSVIAQKLLLDSLDSGVKGLILDKGQSFKKLTLYTGGNIFSEKFNPLQFKNPHYLKAFLMSLVPEAELSIKDQGRMFSLIKDYLALGVDHTFNGLVSFLAQHFDGIEYYFNELQDFISDSKIRITDITYVDTALYPKKIIAPLIIYLIEYFKNIEGKKIFLFDECWEYLERNSEYIEECFRTFRKHNASAIAITQDVADFLSNNSKVGQVIFNNTNHKLFFYQDTTSTNLISEEDSSRIQTLRSVHGSHSEFFYKDDSVRKTVRYYATPLEYELFTTKKEDNLKQEKYREIYGEFLDFKTLMDNWVDFKYNHGGMNVQ
jgi:hypothetical protein